MNSDPMAWRIGLVGYGEVGRILAEDLRQRSVAVSAYDIKQGGEEEVLLAAHAQRFGVRFLSSHAELARQSDLIISAVTPSQTLAVAKACAPHQARAFFLDINSASPGIKCETAELLAKAGGRFVEGAIMTSVPPYRIGVPLLLGGPNAEALVEPLTKLGFAPRLADERLGIASATKMCRSVVIKGLEAMLIESLCAARHFGVQEQVITSLAETFPGIDWEHQTNYMFGRVIAHGRRRTEEMREVAQTIREAGLEPWSTIGTAERQAWMAGLTDAGLFGERSSETFAKVTDWRKQADRILADLPKTKTEEE
jgi:3-hydroxyisobutyrate dehydrogenase-like beta-hydroxyacid dehydrogenase